MNDNVFLSADDGRLGNVYTHVVESMADQYKQKPEKYLQLSSVDSAYGCLLITERKDFKNFLAFLKISPVLKKLNEQKAAKLYYLMALIRYFREWGRKKKLYYQAVQELYGETMGTGGMKGQAIRVLLDLYTDSPFLDPDFAPEHLEGRVVKLLFSDGGEKELRPGLIEGPEDREGLNLLVKVHRWFLSRYDTWHAKLLNRRIRKVTKGKPLEDAEEAFKGESYKSYRTRSGFWGIMILVMISAGWLSYYSRIFCTVWLAGLYLLPFGGTVFLVFRPKMWYHNLLPRLLCGTILGYLFLMSNEAWQGSMLWPYSGEEAWTVLVSRIVLRIGLPLVVCLGYLVIEINNVLKGNRTFSHFAFRRAGCIFLQGLFYSLYLGVLFSHLFGTNLLGDHATGASRFTDYLTLGYVYPSNILMLAPLALFIGIFTQIIWEDKAITYPI